VNDASERPLDAFELVGALARHEVDYVVIGGVALQAHGHVRTTLDLDVVAAWTRENMQRLAGALRELDARLRGVDADMLGVDLGDPTTLYEGGNFLMHTRHGDLDVFAVDQTPGAPPRYEDLRARAVAVEIRGVTLRIAHPDDLIRMKTFAAQFRDRPAAKRRQDLDDVAVLESLRTDQTRPAGREPAPPPPRPQDPSRSTRATRPAPGSHEPPKRGGPSLSR
jgi:hypothetical protein